MSISHIDVVDQEEYVETLYNIIEKDYYPDLHKIKKEEKKIENQQNSMFDPALRAEENHETDIPESLHLDSYQATHISEDSQTFGIVF